MGFSQCEMLARNWREGRVCKQAIFSLVPSLWGQLSSLWPSNKYHCSQGDLLCMTLSLWVPVSSSSHCLPRLRSSASFLLTSSGLFAAPTLWFTKLLTPLKNHPFLNSYLNDTNLNVLAVEFHSESSIIHINSLRLSFHIKKVKIIFTS